MKKPWDTVFLVLLFLVFLRILMVLSRQGFTLELFAWFVAFLVLAFLRQKS